VGIDGDEAGCALPTIGKLADLTAGTTNILQPIELITQIVKISQKQIVATNVSATFYGRRNEVQWVKRQKKQSDASHQVGNATLDTVITQVSISNKKTDAKYEIDTRSDMIGVCV